MGIGWKWAGRSADIAQLWTALPDWLRVALLGSPTAILMTWAGRFVSDLRWEYLLALSVAVLCGLSWAAVGVVTFWRHSRHDAGTETAPLGFDVLGRTRDGVAMMRSGDRLLEFDSYANQFYIGLDANDRERVRRSLMGTTRSQINRWDLTQVLSNQGEPIRDEPVFPVVRRIPENRTTEFFTRTQLRLGAEDRGRARQNTDLWRWYKGDGWAWDAENLLREGAQLIEASAPAPRPALPAKPAGDIMALINPLVDAEMKKRAEAQLLTDTLPAWTRKVWAYFARYHGD